MASFWTSNAPEFLMKCESGFSFSLMQIRVWILLPKIMRIRIRKPAGRKWTLHSNTLQSNTRPSLAVGENVSLYSLRYLKQTTPPSPPPPLAPSLPRPPLSLLVLSVIRLLLRPRFQWKEERGGGGNNHLSFHCFGSNIQIKTGIFARSPSGRKSWFFIWGKN